MLKNNFKTVALFLIVVPFILYSCVSFHEVTAADKENIRQIVTRITQQIKVNHIYEKELIENGLNELLLYLVAAKSDSLLAESESFNSITDFRNYFVSQLHKTPMEFGLEALIYWDATTHYDYTLHKNDMLTYESEHFLYRVFKDTSAHKDIEKIIYLSEEYVSDLIEFINPSGDILKRFAGNFNYLEKNKIILELPPNSKYWKGFNQTASMEFGCSIGDQGLNIKISIAIPYYNSLSSSVLTHEITHMVDLLFKINLEEIQVFSKLKGDELKKRFDLWWNNIFRGVFPHDTQFGEGFAEYTANRFSIFYKDLVLKPDQVLQLTKKNRPIRLNILKQPAKDWDRRVRLLQYTELHSIVNYLIEKYGKERFIKFYFSPPLTEDRFISFYDKTYNELENEWRAFYGF